MIGLVEDYRTIAASNDGFLVVISSNLSHLWVYGADIAYLSSPKRATVLDIEIFVTFAHLIAIRIAVFDI